MGAVTATPLQALLEHAGAHLATAGGGGHVARVDFGKSGAMHVELANGERRCWHTWDQGALKELKVAEDGKVPLASRLGDPEYAARVSVLSYRPRRRVTLLDRSDHEPRIVKGFRRGRLAGMVARYEAAHLAFGSSGIHAPEVIGCDDKTESLAMACQAGERLRLSADTTDLFHLVGEGLRAFQDHGAAEFPEVFDSDAELRVIDKRAARLERVARGLPEGWTELRARLDAARLLQPSAEYGLAHRDLHDKQFVQQLNYLALLDFDLMCRADVCLDPANFLAHLVLRNLQGVRGASQRSIDGCGKKFLQGLGRNEEPGFWERLRFYQAGSFCRLALVYALRPQWIHVVPQLVTMGNRCLDDLHRIQAR